jgi:hypothetical protein
MNIFIDFPEVRQSTDYTCGPSSVQAILYYYGISLGEDQLSELLKTDDNNGTQPKNIIQCCREMGLSAIDKQKMTINDIKYYLSRKIPILVVYQAWGDNLSGWDSGHYSVIIGLVGDNIIFEDPSLIGKGYIPIKEFMERWHDVDSTGKVYNRYGIMIYGMLVQYSSKTVHRIR